MPGHGGVVVEVSVQVSWLQPFGYETWRIASSLGLVVMMGGCGVLYREPSRRARIGAALIGSGALLQLWGVWAS